MAEGEVIRELENVGSGVPRYWMLFFRVLSFQVVAFPLQLRGTPRPYISSNNDYQELKNWRIRE